MPPIFGRKFTHAVGPIALLVLFAVPAPAQSLDALYDKAKSEGALTLYAGGPTAVWDAAVKEFSARYPGVAVSVTGGFSNVLDKKIDAQLADGKLAAGPVVPQICRAMNAFAGEDFYTCVTLLELVLDDVVRIGGSHAQREIIEDTFVVALIRSGELSRAQALLDHRLHRRPSPRDARWRDAATR